MKLTGSQIVIEVLLEQGVNTVFGYPGGTALNIYDELYKYSDKIRHVLTAHEQGACHAADGYARATGKTGVVMSTSGPGATNLVTGIYGQYSYGSNYSQRSRQSDRSRCFPGNLHYRCDNADYKA